MEKKNISRRLFLGGAAAAGAALTEGCGSFNILPRNLLGGSPRYIAPSQKLNIAAIGCGGKGESDIECCATENIVALCDVDSVRAAASLKKFPGAKVYKDFRDMLENHKEIDAVIVSTPDHTHAPAAVMAMKKGYHVYCQKPLTHDVYEARVMHKTARETNVITQMGNQGCAVDGFRTAVEVIQSGAIGKVSEVHVWTNRPIWPQGIDHMLPEQKVPDTMDWNLWIAAAPYRPYNAGYAPFKWRGWWDFGTGALGDMGCHTANMAFMALKLGYPKSISAEKSGINDQTAPNWAMITYEFPARGDMPPVTFKWYDGGKMPPEDLAQGHKFSKSGLLLVGDKGTLFSPNDYGSEFVLLPEKNFKDYKAPSPILPRLGGGDNDFNHHQEWIKACKGGNKPLSEFNYSAFLTETIVLGNLALRVDGKLNWDAEKMRVTNNDAANKFLRREYREGYKV